MYSTISDYEPANAEWVLGHNKSPYWTKKEEIRREKYIKCMKALTFLDFSGLVTSTKNIESKLEQKDKEIHNLTHEVYLLDEALEEIKEYLKIQNDFKSNKNKKTTR